MAGQPTAEGMHNVIRLGRSTSGRLGALAGVGAAAVGLAIAPVPLVHADTASFSQLGSLPVPQGVNLKTPFNSTDRMVIDSQAHLGAVLMFDSTANKFFVRIYDLSGVAQVADVPVPTGTTIADGNNGLTPAVVDQVHHRVFYAFSAAGCPNSNPIQVLDLTTHAWTTRPVPCPPTPTNQGLELTAMAYDPTDDGLDVLGYDGSQAASHVLTRQATFYAADMSAADGTVRWLIPVADCGDYSPEPASTAAAGEAIAHTGSSVIIACQRPSSSPTAAAHTNVVVKLPLGQDGHPVVDSSGNPTSHSVVAVGDVGAGYDGADTFHFVSNLSSYGFGSYVFDTTTMEFAGVVATGGGTQLNSTDSIRAFGVDASTGRIYIRNQKALIVSDARHRPLPAGVPYPSMADPYPYQGTEAPSHEISVDSVLHRIIVEDLATNTYQVYQDDVPLTVPAAASNPDTATTDTAEAPGLTTANFSGSGSAFGLLTLTEGGYDGIVNGIPFACNPGLASSLGPAACPANQLTTPGDRRTFYGHAVQAALTNQETTGVAAPIHIDDSATSKDLGSGGVDPAQTVDGAGQQWPADVVQCSDLGGGKKVSSEQSGAGTAHVSCDLGGTAVTSSGQYTSQTNQYQGTVSTVRDADKGELTTSTASAQNITIPIPGGTPLLVRQVDASATTQAHGRPGTASASYARKIQGFESPSYSCDTSCDPQQVATAITQSLTSAGLLAYALAPTPDRTYFPNGTPGGYQAVVAKDKGLRVSEAAVNDDPTDTVAGLEIVYVNDNGQGRSRQIVQFAAVHAESHYGITLLPAALAATGGTSAAPTRAARGPAGGSASVSIHGVDVPQGATADTTVIETTPGAPSVISSPVRPSTRSAAPPPSLAPAPGASTAPARSGPLGSLWQLLIADPKRAAALAVLWAVLLSPVYLAIRRRALLHNIEVAT